MKFAIFFLFLFNSGFAQKNVNKAQKMIYIAQYYNAKSDKKQALELYEKSFVLNPHAFKANILPFSKLCYELNKPQKIKETVEKTSHFYLYQKDFFDDLLHEYVIYNEIRSQVDKLQKNYYHNKENYKKIEFEKKLIELNYADQYLRTLDYENEGIIPFDLVEREDSMVIKKLIELTKIYGWSENAETILWHQRSEEFRQSTGFWSYFTPFLNNQISKDLLRKDFFVKYDWNLVLINRNTAFKYEYLSYLKQFYTPEVVNAMDENRKKVGLPPLYFGKLIYPDTTMPPGYIYNPNNLLKDLEDL